MPSEPQRTVPEAKTPEGGTLDRILVACLCAEWCTACRDYRTVFEKVRADHPDLQFLWVDIEDSAALLDRIEVENFPTILIGEGATPRFFGPVTPQREVLQRLIAVQRRHDTSRANFAADISALLLRLQGSAG
jgi:thiol-disulfide isomerase/thioredoxin